MEESPGPAKIISVHTVGTEPEARRPRFRLATTIGVCHQLDQPHSLLHLNAHLLGVHLLGETQPDQVSEIARHGGPVH
jgi:hypothetical protein